MSTKLNISKIIREAINQPSILIGDSLKPIYPTLKNSDGTYEADPAYAQRVSKGFINSPTNIRKIFITHKKVYMEYYAPAGVPNNYSYKCIKSLENTELSSIITETSMGMQSNIKLIGDNNMMSFAPPKYEADGSVNNLLTHPFYLNNVEEVYFDWILLLSPDMQQAFSAITGVPMNSEILFAMCRDASGLPSQDNNIFYNIIAPTDKDSFKRLKTVAFIQNLDQALDTYIREDQNSSKHYYSWGPFKYIKSIEKTEESEEFIKYYSQTWFDHYKHLCSVAIGYNTNINNATNTEFTLKDNQYVFDKKVLKDRYEIFKLYFGASTLKKFGDTSLDSSTTSETDVNKNSSAIPLSGPTENTNSESTSNDAEPSEIDKELEGFKNKQVGSIEEVSNIVDKSFREKSMNTTKAFWFVLTSLRYNFGFSDQSERAFLLKTISDSNRDNAKKILG